jgi:hypothetical protein
MSWIEHKEKYEAIVEEIEPASVLITKDHVFWKILWWTATIATLGLFALGMKKKVFLEEYATTLFPIQGYPSSFEALSTRLLVHECRHTTHCVYLGYLIPILGWIPGKVGRHIRAWCGAPFYAGLYLLFILPSVFAAGRWLFELDCDRVAYKWQIGHGYKVGEILNRAKKFGGKVCSGRYFWAWLKSLGGVTLFEWVAKRVIADYIAENRFD